MVETQIQRHMIDPNLLALIAQEQEIRLSFRSGDIIGSIYDDDFSHAFAAFETSVRLIGLGE